MLKIVLLLVQFWEIDHHDLGCVIDDLLSGEFLMLGFDEVQRMASV